MLSAEYLNEAEEGREHKDRNEDGTGWHKLERVECNADSTFGRFATLKGGCVASRGCSVSCFALAGVLTVEQDSLV